MPETSVTEERIFENSNQITRFLNGEGFLVAYNTVSKHIRLGTLRPRRGGGYAERTVLSWARQYVQRRSIDPSPEAGTPDPVPDTSIAEREAELKVELKEQALRTARFEEQVKRGRFIDITTLDAELGERARAFRIALEKFGQDAGIMVAADFGGESESAGELVRRLGLSGEKAVEAEKIVMDFALSRVPLFLRRWMDRVDLFLDPYSGDQWWTEAMSEAWQKWLEHGDDEGMS